MENAPKLLDAVKDYYGKRIQKTDDLISDACCVRGAPPAHIREIIKLLDPEVENTYYGCGLVIPQVLDGLRVLDLGSGTGRDCFILSKLVGERGHVVGVDMTDEQLAKANAKVEYHTKAFNYAKPNIEFRKGYIEKLDELGLEKNSFDLIVSNCVINLSPDKRAVLEGVYRLLKPGGELYFSDVYCDRRVPKNLMEDPVLWGECLTGALYWNDFISIAKAAGFTDPRLVQAKRMPLSGAIAAKLEPLRFYSAEFRLFKIPELDLDCEDYGQAVAYRGTITTHPHVFQLDAHHAFATGRVQPVCRNSYRMLKDSRHAQHFSFYGDGAVHFGLFEGCGKANPLDNDGKCCAPPGEQQQQQQQQHPSANDAIVMTNKAPAAGRCC